MHETLGLPYYRDYKQLHDSVVVQLARRLKAGVMIIRCDYTRLERHVAFQLVNFTGPIVISGQGSKVL